MSKIILTHNGTTLKSFNTHEEVISYMTNILEVNKNLRPNEIFSGYKDDADIQVRIYQYYTKTTEVFMIQEFK